MLEQAVAHDRVRANSTDEINARLDREAEQRVAAYRVASEADLSARIEELNREWDMERLLQLNAASFAMLGALLARLHSRWWLLLTLLVTTFLIQHAVQGWCPPLVIFRRLGVRTRKEIDREKMALMALRGDFAGLAQG